jgi:signal transduction histidine kinase
VGTTIEINFLNALLFLVAFLNISLGIVVLSRSPSSVLNRWFFALAISAALWAFTNSVFTLVDEGTSYPIALISYGAAASLAYSFFNFCYHFVGSAPRRLPRLLYLFLYLSILLIAVSPGVLATGVDQDFNIQTNTLLLAAFGAFIVGSLSAGLWVLVARLKVSKSNQERLQIRVILFGFLVATVVGLIFNLFFPLIGIYRYVELGPAGVGAFIASTTYAMAKHHLFDIRVAAVRTVAYLLSIAALASLYFGLAYTASILIFDTTASGVSMSPINVAIALVLALIFQPIKHFFDRITDSIFFRDLYVTDVFISELGDILTTSTTLVTMLEHASQHIQTNLKASSVTFVVTREGRSDIVVGSGTLARISSRESAEIMQYVQGSQEASLVDELSIDIATLKEKPALQTAQRHHISILLPLADDIGYVMIGDQKASGYTKRDINVLNTISDELVIAIQNARSLEEVQQLNKTLQQRVDKATKELRSSNTKLRKLDATKDEFISMASHQLRTPLTSIKGYVSMLLDGDAGELSPQQRKLLSEAFVSSERMVRLISDFLNVSRLQTGKFILDPKQVNLVRLVEEEIESIERMAAQHDIHLSFRSPRSFPTLVIDEDKVRQVVMNFIDNAVYYSRPKSTIVVKLHKDVSDIVFEVHDHGIGVPKEMQGQLFTKFFRADNARRKRPDGTGIGLYLAKKIIMSHGGQVLFSSTEGKGSMFGFRIPIKQPTENQ